MPKLRSVPPPPTSRAPPTKALIQFYRELGWLEIILGSWELNAYWSSRFVLHRWRRFEHKHHSLVAGPLTVLVQHYTKHNAEHHEHPHLRPIDGGKA